MQHNLRGLRVHETENMNIVHTLEMEGFLIHCYGEGAIIFIINTYYSSLKTHHVQLINYISTYRSTNNQC